jgi:carboxypeptidase Taq
MPENMLNNPMPISTRLKPIVSCLTAIDQYRQISALLSWDQETMMPSGAIDARSKQLETLSGAMHDAWNSPELTHAMHALVHPTTGEPTTDLTPTEAAFMRECYPQWKRNTALPKPLVQQLTKATSQAQHAWQNARATNNFSLFSPHLAELIQLTKEKINALTMPYDHPYDTLIDEFEPGMTVAQLDAIFAPLKEQTMAFLNTSPQRPCPSIVGPFNAEAQLDYSRELMVAMGYSTDHGRLDVSAHPFTIDIHPSDVRITTRVDTDHLFESLSSTIHEVGHALYEQGLDPEWAGTPFGAARSMGIHESQSRLWELFIGQSAPFWQGQLSRIHHYFPNTSGHTANDFFMASNAIQPHWCRVKSDAITYNLHIILRYECEKALFDGSLEVNDLPKVWNQKMADSLGIHIDNDAQGCLQDVHWSAGLFGYFPSYTLGTLIAAELFAIIDNALDDLPKIIASGDFRPITQWLNTHVHWHGSKKTTADLLSDLGVCMTPQALFDHFKTAPVNWINPV